MRYFLILVASISFISGCGGGAYSVDPSLYSQIFRHSYVTNYKIAEIKTAYVGQSIVKVKDYYVFKDYTNTFVEPTENFTLTAKVQRTFSADDIVISGIKGKRYELYYKKTIDGIEYKIVYFTESNPNNGYGVLIDDAGNVKNDVFHEKGTITDFSLQPSDVKFHKSIVTEENFLCDPIANYYGNTCGSINYELIYGGINNISMNISYKEYSREDYARAAFYQDLTFEPKAKQIRFKDFIIEVIEATNEKLSYKILSDGLKETELTASDDPAFTRILMDNARMHQK